jgi:orotidine-5'-phosphate decarboxylase
VRPPYLERLAARSAATGTVLCLGLDPDPGSLPEGFSADLQGLEAFAEIVLEAAMPFAAAVKPNLAFFEAFGSEGIAILERLRARIPGDVPVVLDAKRGDIGSTTARQAVALFDHLGGDAVTANPYLGSEALRPLLERPDRFVYVLCRTSNPGAGELQDLALVEPDEPGSAARPLYAHVARGAATWGPGGTVGLVVGATASAGLQGIREVAPALPFLVPGVGAQGGEIGPALEHGRAREGAAAGLAGGGLLVNVSRGIAGAAGGSGDAGRRGDVGRHGEVAERIAAAAREWSLKLPVLS